MPTPVVTSLATGSSSVATTTVSFSAQAAGTLLVLSYAGDDYHTTSGSGRPESTSWINITSQRGSGQFHGSAIWYKFATGSETSVQYTIGSASRSAYNLIAISDISAYDGVANSQHANGSTTSYTTPAITPTAGDRLIVGMITASRGSGTVPAVSAWTNSFTAQGSGLSSTAPGLVTGLATRQITATGSTISTGGSVTGPQPDAFSGHIASFRVSAGGAPNVAATFASTSALSAAPTMSVPESATLASVSGLSAAPTMRVPVSVSMGSTSTLSATPGVIRALSVTFTSSSALSIGAPTLVATPAVAIGSTSALVPSPGMRAPAAVTFASTSALAATPQAPPGSLSVTFSSTSALAATPTKTTAVSATFGSVSALAGTPTKTTAVSATFASVSALATTAPRVDLGVTFASTSALSATPQGPPGTLSVTFSSTSGLSATPALSAAVSTLFGSVSALTAGPTKVTPVSVTFGSVSALNATPTMPPSGLSVTFSSTSGLSASPGVVRQLGVVFASVSGLIANIQPPGGYPTIPSWRTLSRDGKRLDLGPDGRNNLVSDGRRTLKEY